MTFWQPVVLHYLCVNKVCTAQFDHVRLGRELLPVQGRSLVHQLPALFGSSLPRVHFTDSPAVFCQAMAIGTSSNTGLICPYLAKNKDNPLHAINHHNFVCLVGMEDLMQNVRLVDEDRDRKPNLCVLCIFQSRPLKMNTFL